MKKKELFYNALLITSFLFLAKFVGLIKEMMMAREFGVSIEVDAYSFLFNIFTLPGAITFSVLSVILVPLLNKEFDSLKLKQFKSELFFILFLLALFLSGGLYIYILSKAGIDGIYKNAETLIYTTLLTKFTLICVISVMVSYISVLLLSRGKHINTLLEGVPSLLIIFSLLMFDGINSLIYGTLIGFVIYFILMSFSYLRGVNYTYITAYFKWSSTLTIWEQFIRGFSVVVISQVLLNITIFVDQLYLAELEVGSLSVFGYYSKLIAIFMSLGAVVITRACLPYFSTSTSGFKKMKDFSNKVSFLLLVVISLLLALLHPWFDFFVSTIYEYGSFTAKNTEQVSNVMLHGVIQIPFYLASMFFLSMFASQLNYRPLLITSIVSLIGKVIVLNIYFDDYGLFSVIYSTNAMYALNFLALVVMSRCFYGK